MKRSAYALMSRLNDWIDDRAQGFVLGYVVAGGPQAAEKLREAIDEGLQVHELSEGMRRDAAAAVRRWRSEARALGQGVTCDALELVRRWQGEAQTLAN